MEIDKFIASLPFELAPLRDVAVRLSSGANEVKSDTIGLSYRPHVAPQFYALRLFSPLPQPNLAQYQLINGINISPHYLPILEKLNGANVFQLSLFGVPPSMANNPPLLDRSTENPYDISIANKNWKFEFDIPKDWFYFGGGPFSFDENVGYFFDSVGTIYSVRNNGVRLSSWHSFPMFLHDEISRCESLYPEYEGFMAELIRESNSPKPWWRRIFKK